MIISHKALKTNLNGNHKVKILPLSCLGRLNPRINSVWWGLDFRDYLKKD